ncbi:MAG: hypothetical protein HXY46_12330 [Syntrophaceae bacterium]|nr:hypothetical protein [Syntrophaceae bacterium]
MTGRYIERKGIIFDKIAEKGDTDQVTKLQKENRQLTEKAEALEVVDSTLRGEYKKVRKALEFVMEVVEDMGEEEVKGHLLKKKKEQLMAEGGGHSDLHLK